MILDIKYFDKGPEQIQGIRLITVYPHYDGIAKPEIVLHFDLRDVIRPQQNIDLATVQSISITRD